MVADFETFLARTKDSSNGNSGLLEHSLKTAHRAKELAASLGFGDVAFYAGLLHDIGKLNPYYQILFSTGQRNSEYLKVHSIFSALAVNRLLNTKILSTKSQKQALFAVAGHHSKLTQFIKSLNYIKHDETRFEKSYDGTCSNLQLFSQTLSNIAEFKDLDWDKCLRKFRKRPLNEAEFVAENDCILDFLDFSSVFSVLIQADRGSFFDDLALPVFDINLNTDVLVRTGSLLSDVRRSFQEWLLSENDFQDNLVILKAPTGIGKTKLFLDIVNKTSKTQQFERVFYFSPLLALTDDFESKLFDIEKDSVLSRADAEKVLVYNHAFTGNLLDKKLSKDTNVLFDDETETLEFLKTPEHFERESFNKQLIITTTQRLLMVLYSNTPADKQKLVSFKNSFLIIDEVQTIPKILLPNFIALLKAVTKKYNSRILLVSATIPHELQNLPKLKTPEDLEQRYLSMTIKQIEYRDVLNVDEIEFGDNDRTLFMFNTRRKALNFFEQLTGKYDNVLYLSSGIKKCDRHTIIQKNIQGKDPVTVVSTQVLEAGVDVSFSRIYRELAPIDNIVQAMGRLNREGEHTNPLLTVFKVDGKCVPYSELEVKESEAQIRELSSSKELYNILSRYYHKVSDENLRNKNLAKAIDGKMCALNFEAVWEFVKNYALPDELGDSILVPPIQEYDQVRKFLSLDSSKGRGKLTRFADFMAQLPSSFDRIDELRDLLDNDLFEKGVLLPKKDALDCVYAPKVGLDKWVNKK